MVSTRKKKYIRDILVLFFAESAYLVHKYAAYVASVMTVSLPNKEIQSVYGYSCEKFILPGMQVYTR